MIETDSIYDSLSGIFRDVFEDDSLNATPELTAADVPGWDSLSNLRLVLTVQKAFGVKFTAREITSLNNVSDLANLIRARR